MGAYVHCMLLALSIFFLISISQASASQDLSTYNRSVDIARKDRDVHTQAAAVRPQWISRSNKFWFRRSNAPGDATFIYIDPNMGLRRPAFDHDGVARALRQQGIEASAANLPFTWIDMNDDLTSVRFRAGEKNWVWKKDGVLTLSNGDIKAEDATEKLKSLAESQPPVKENTAVIGDGISALGSPTETRSDLSRRQSNGTSDGSGVFFQDNNVWFRDTNGQEFQMSTTGSKDSPFNNWTYPSPDKRFFVAFQSTKGQDHTVSIVESSPSDQLQPRLQQFQYLKPGDKVAIDRPRMFDLTTKQEVPTDNGLFQNPYQINTLNNGGWNAEGTEFRFVYNQRGHQVLRVVGMNTQGDVRAIVEETSDTFIDYSSKLYYRELSLSNSSEMIWASERDGWNHLYLYDMKAGRVKNQITKGEWVVRSVDYVDEAKRQIWVKVFGAVTGQDPYYAHLARVNFDGSDFKILTEGDGSHSWYFSEDRTTFTDTWSRMDMAPTTVTRDAETGNKTADVSTGNLDWILWPVPERFATPGRDGSTLIHGLIFRPYEMDNSTKYPVIEKIYAGPQDFYVPKEYTTHDEAHKLANQGFVVVLIDGMGTNWRSKAFHDVCYKNLKDAGFPDRIAWIKAAASTRPWMDIDRVGVYGGSAGGQNAMGALLFHNDFYRVAAADCGCHDNRMDKLWWNEAWMGYPVDQSYEVSSNVVNAWRLEGSLMLSVGELDTNVDPASTMQVVHALNNAGKDYDLLFIPGGGHGVATSDPYALRRTQEFLSRKLKEVNSLTT
jgi:dipeptidyl-peptidase-4